MAEQLIVAANAAAGTLTTYRVCEDRLQHVGVTEVGVGCSTFHVVGDYLYVATKEPAIVVCRVDRETGELTRLAAKPIPAPLAYLSAPPDGVSLLGASYHAGWAMTWPIQGAEIGEPTSPVFFRNLHSIVASADGRYAFAASLGDDLIAVCQITDAGLIAVQELPAPEGCGPRHLILSPDQDSLYVVTEFTGQLLRYTRAESGSWGIADSANGYDQNSDLRVSRYGADPVAEHLIWGADLHLAGQWLLSSERTESTVAAIRVGLDGALVESGAITKVEAQPRGFAVTPDGALAVVAGEASGEIGLYRVDPTNGALHRMDQVHSGGGPNWVRFLSS